MELIARIYLYLLITFGFFGTITKLYDPSAAQQFWHIFEFLLFMGIAVPLIILVIVAVQEHKKNKKL